MSSEKIDPRHRDAVIAVSLAAAFVAVLWVPREIISAVIESDALPRSSRGSEVVQMYFAYWPLLVGSLLMSAACVYRASSWLRGYLVPLIIAVCLFLFQVGIAYVLPFLALYFVTVIGLFAGAFLTPYAAYKLFRFAMRRVGGDALQFSGSRLESLCFYGVFLAVQVLGLILLLTNIYWFYQLL